MSYITLSDAKKHLAVIHSADDDLIQDCLDAAEEYAAQYMGRTDISDGQDWNLDAVIESSSNLEMVPRLVVRAIMFVLADFYELRSQTITGPTVTKLPAAEAMLHFYRTGLGV